MPGRNLSVTKLFTDTDSLEFAFTGPQKKGPGLIDTIKETFEYSLQMFFFCSRSGHRGIPFLLNIAFAPMKTKAIWYNTLKLVWSHHNLKNAKCSSMFYNKGNIFTICFINLINYYQGKYWEAGIDHFTYESHSFRLIT